MGAGQSLAIPAVFNPWLMLAALNLTNIVAIGMSSTIGLAVLLIIKASRSLELLFFAASGRIIEPVPIILNAQSKKVAGSNLIDLTKRTKFINSAATACKLRDNG